MLSLGRRLSALLLPVALVATSTGVCAAWMAAPEAPMVACPMHQSERAPGGMGQADADRCCVAAEQRSAPAPAALVAPQLLVVPSAPSLGSTEVRPIRFPLATVSPPGRVARHLILSVLLV